MDENVKMPFLSEETMRAQRVEVYLEDLKSRLKDLRIKHDEVIQNSVEIIKELDQVSSSLLLSQREQSQSTEKMPKIKQLIQEFETAKETRRPSSVTVIDSKVNIRQILQNFEKLNQCHVLKESLVLFKRAKESFEKIDTIIGKQEQNQIRPRLTGNNNYNNTAACSTSSPTSPPEVEIFVEGSRELPSQYSSCCSSVMSIDTFHSTEEICHTDKRANSLENGYDGDNDDSEYDLLASIQKRQKLK